MKQICDVAIVGAGPYGLSLAAHLDAAGISFRVFGKPLSTWRDHMPKGMKLKSDGFASNLSAPAPDSTLGAYCAQRGIPYADQDLPVEADVFLAYADWFRARYAAMLEEQNVVALEKSANGFSLRLEDGERFEARAVVMAVGITWFAYTPEIFARLPAEAVSHSFHHHDVSGFAGREVAVVGAGASAIDTAVALSEAGARTRIVARRPVIPYHAAPDNGGPSLLKRLQYPSSGIGPGWRSFLYANQPLLFHKLPEKLRLRITRNHLGPAPAWFMRERVEDKVATDLGWHVTGAAMEGGKVALDLARADGARRTVTADHVIAATGYRVDLKRLPFLDARLGAGIAAVNRTPIVSTEFETSVPGLYVTGPASANSFGPLMRFMVGSEFAAPRLAGHIARKLGARTTRRAA